MAKKKQRNETAKTEATPQGFFEAVGKLIDAWNSYDEDHAAFWAAVDHAIESQPATPLDESGRFDVHAAFIRFQGEVNVYDERHDPEGIAEPHADFWRALDALATAYSQPTREPNRPESIAVLTKQNVPATQICAIWGLVDEHGRPSIALLEQEQATPGSVIGEKYEWPTLRKCREERTLRYAVYLSLIVEKGKAGSGQRQPCKETPEELYRQAVPVDQAARMLCIESDEAAKLWSKFEKKMGKPEQSVPVTDARGEPLPEFVQTTRIETAEPTGPAPRSSSTYGDLEEVELRELCEVSELSTEGTRDELIARLEESDQQQPVGA
jgi:hypothetical protein